MYKKFRFNNNNKRKDDIFLFIKKIVYLLIISVTVAFVEINQFNMHALKITVRSEDYITQRTFALTYTNSRNVTICEEVV